jgi:hypothetical protein
MFSSFSAEAREKQEIIREILAERPPERSHTQAEQQTLKRGAKYAKSYVEAVKTLRISQPLPKDLEKATGISASRWRRLFRDLLFWGETKREVRKMQGYRYSHKPETKKFWKQVEQGIDEKIVEAEFSNDALVRGKKIPYKDSVKRKMNPYEDLADVMSEEVGRDFGRKKSVRGETDD